MNKPQKSPEQKISWKTLEGCQKKCSYAALDVVMVRFSAGYQSASLSAGTCGSHLEIRQDYTVGDDVVDHIM